MNFTIKEAIVSGKTSFGIEFGSTRIKAVLIDCNFETISSTSYDWENRLVNGYWTYDLHEVVTGLQEVYRQIKQEVEDKYGITLNKIGSIGCSAMMQGYIALNKKGDLLVPFRTWRNATTGIAAAALSDKFQFKIPQRWSVAHLYQAILDNEEHVADIDYITTLSGYIHWRLTGEKVLGICDASGMFPINERTHQYHQKMIKTFTALVADKGYPWNLTDILPNVFRAGEHAGNLSDAGARLLDPSGSLEAGIPLCPPEGDAGTGMVATNSVKKRSGNISVGTSIFAMIVLEKDLSRVYPEIDIVNTPDGNPVAMVLANNCSSDINAWIGLFREFHEALGNQSHTTDLFKVLFNKALEADEDGGGLLSYNYYSGENITGFAKGRPLFVRSPESRFNLANFMRMHLFSAFAALRLGMDILTKDEHVVIEHIMAHGGLFKTPIVGQKICGAALNVPVSTMLMAGEGGAWGMAILASYMANRKQHETLPDYLTDKVFKNITGQKIFPDSADVEGFEKFMKRYKRGLAIEQAAVDHFLENYKE